MCTVFVCPLGSHAQGQSAYRIWRAPQVHSTHTRTLYCTGGDCCINPAGKAGSCSHRQVCFQDDGRPSFSSCMVGLVNHGGSTSLSSYCSFAGPTMASYDSGPQTLGWAALARHDVPTGLVAAVQNLYANPMVRQERGTDRNEASGKGDLRVPPSLSLQRRQFGQTSFRKLGGGNRSLGFRTWTSGPLGSWTTFRW